MDCNVGGCVLVVYQASMRMLAMCVAVYLASTRMMDHIV